MIFLKEGLIIITIPREYANALQNNPVTKKTLKGLVLCAKRLLQYLLVDRFVIVKEERIFHNPLKCNAKFLKIESH